MKISFDCVGCRLNQSEIERMAHQVRTTGHEVVATPEESDMVVINTCAVTAAAGADSRAKVRKAHRRNPQARIILTGCWSDLEAEKAANFPGVTNVIPNAEKEALIPQTLGIAIKEIQWDQQARQAIPGERRRTRAFIKVQDGCDNHCTYCLATLARGPARSQPIEDVVAEILSAITGGVKEVVLTGAQLSSYGRDLTENVTLTSLLEAILVETEIPRIRLSSMEPWELPAGLFDIMCEPRICRQIHLPLQSGCANTLRRMGRPIQPTEYARLLDKARSTIPGLSVTTDIMVGFPGETDHDFHESLAFIEGMAFAGAHVFVYSPRPGTAAVQLPNQVPVHIARERSHHVRQSVRSSGYTFREGFLGQVMTVLWETSEVAEPHGWTHSGLTDNYIRIRTYSDQNLRNQLSEVRLVSLNEEIVHGKLVS